MNEMLATAIRIATAPLRLFGRSRYFRLGARRRRASSPSFFAVTLWALDRFFPGGNAEDRAALAKSAAAAAAAAGHARRPM